MMEIFKEFNLLEYNSYKLDARCARAFFPESEDDFRKIYNDLASKPPHVIGNGNNIIFSKTYYDEDFLILNGNFNKIVFNGSIVTAEAGATLKKLSEIALEKSLSGLEIFCDIPSSVGGAIVMNAGTKEGEIKDILLNVRYLDLVDMKVKEVYKEDMEFEYRNSFFQRNTDKIVLQASFQLNSGDTTEIRRNMLKSIEMRWAKQPRELPNCGSVFKRPPGRFVGPMLDELGLKGYSIGGAKISEKHSGFIVNTGNATGEDIIRVIKHTKELVLNRFSVNLEIEQRII